MQFGIHHYAHRKQQVKQTNTTYWQKIIGMGAYSTGILGPLLTIDQVQKVWIEKTVEGISVISWGANFLFAIIWVVYGITHKERVIIVTNVLWMIMNGLVVFGTLLYRI